MPCSQQRIRITFCNITRQCKRLGQHIISRLRRYILPDHISACAGDDVMVSGVIIWVPALLRNIVVSRID